MEESAVTERDAPVLLNRKEMLKIKKCYFLNGRIDQKIHISMSCVCYRLQALLHASRQRQRISRH